MTARRVVADGVVSLGLAPAAGGDLPQWTPGAHVDLLLPNGLVRQYSLCGPPGGDYRIAVLREPAGRGGSAYVHDRLTEGSRVTLAGPRNNFALAPASAYLFIAGGIGITPLLPMLATAEAAGADWRLVYGGRARTSMAFRDELRRYGDRVSVRPERETGLLDLPSILAAAPPDAHVYCCGPEGLLRAVEDLVTPDLLHVERFTHREPDPTGGAFEVELATSGRTLTVDPGVSILDSLERAGIFPLSSCREGTCGTCETTVLDGRPDHRDSLLTPAERAANDLMFICVSRSLSPRLVLDL